MRGDSLVHCCFYENHVVTCRTSIRRGFADLGHGGLRFR
jgi:hypothetical protein